MNETLALARDSTERATKALSDRAEQLVREVGEEMAALIARIMMQDNFEEKLFKLLVEEPSHRRKLKQLSDRLVTVEGYLAFQDIELEPRAHLVKGMALHLRQEDQAAIPLLERAAEATGMGLRLRLCAYYFMGYAYNNIGEYRSAAAAFDAGHSRASDQATLRDEFARMGAESNFFELVRSHLDARSDVTDSVDRLVKELTVLRDRVTPAAKANLHQTLGNIHLFLAREKGRTQSFHEALSLFRDAGKGLWAQFGQLEVINEAGAAISAEVDSPSVKEVENLATQKIQTRGEPRSLTLLHLATAKCRVWQAASNASVRAALSAVNDQMGKVDSDLRLYSLWLRSNVTREQFIDHDVRKLEDS